MCRDMEELMDAEGRIYQKKREGSKSALIDELAMLCMTEKYEYCVGICVTNTDEPCPTPPPEYRDKTRRRGQRLARGARWKDR